MGLLKPHGRHRRRDGQAGLISAGDSPRAWRAPKAPSDGETQAARLIAAVAIPLPVIAGAWTVVARPIAAIIIAVVDHGSDERHDLLHNVAELVRRGSPNRRLRLRPRRDLLVAQARTGVRLQAREQRAIDRHPPAAAAVLIVLLRRESEEHTSELQSHH